MSESSPRIIMDEQHLVSEIMVAALTKQSSFEFNASNVCCKKSENHNLVFYIKCTGYILM